MASIEVKQTAELERIFDRMSEVQRGVRAGLVKASKVSSQRSESDAFRLAIQNTTHKPNHYATQLDTSSENTMVVRGKSR
jgi:hypothetical protein